MEKMTKENGFSLLELMIVLAIIAILSAIAVPNYFSWLPKYRLKTAATDLFSNMQLVKLQAVKTNQNVSIKFSTGPDRYRFAILSGTKTISLSDTYRSGIVFGRPAAFPGDTVTYGSDILTFNTRGISNAGYAYLTNSNNTGYYRVGTLSSGVIRLESWNSGAWE